MAKKEKTKPQIVITFRGLDNLNFTMEITRVDPLQLAALAVFLDEQARLALRQKIMYNSAKVKPRVIVPNLEVIPKA